MDPRLTFTRIEDKSLPMSVAARSIAYHLDLCAAFPRRAKDRRRHLDRFNSHVMTLTNLHNTKTIAFPSAEGY